MFFKGNYVRNQVKDRIYKQRRLFLLCSVWCVLIMVMAIKSDLILLGTPMSKICQADLLILFQYRGYFELYMFPFILFVVMRCKLDSLNMQYIIRFQKRKQVILRQMAESIVYALGMSAFIVGSEVILGSMQKLSFINWEYEKSFCYFLIGRTIFENYMTVVTCVFFMYVVKFLIVFAILDILLWYPKGMVLLWIFIVFIGLIERFTLEKEIFHGLFAVKHKMMPFDWNDFFLYFLGILIVILEYQIGIFITQKKDVYG